MCIVGRACQKDDVAGTGRGATMGRLFLPLAAAEADVLGPATAGGLSTGLTKPAARFLSFSFSFFSFSFFSFFFAFLTSSSFSTSLYIGTPFSRLVSASLDGRGSQNPAHTLVAVRRCLL